ncbi:MAG: S8 family serine peptidase, partial [Bacteroidota bacterium]
VIEAAGILCPFSAGNDGPGISTLGFPAMLAYNELNAMSVGAVNGNVSGFPIADFSSRGPTTCVDTTGPLNIKPEVSAPGVSVRSASGHDGYANLSGTSMSCPHVAGAFLLLKEAFPHLSAYELKNALYQTASDLGEPGEDNTYGKGLIDVYAAYQYLATSYDPVPPVTDSFDIDVNFEDYYPAYFCPGHETWAPAINLINRGQEDISEVHYHYCLNYGDTISNVTGGINPNWGYDITLDSIELPPGYNELYLWAEIPDAGREYNRFNNADVISINMVGTENYPWSENFADMQNGFRNTSWFVKNEDNERTWAVSDVNGGETHALMMNCLNYFDKGQKDHIHSPVISLPETDTIRLRFNLAYKKRMEYLFADSIMVYASTDCNSHDFPHLLYSDGGETMATVEGNTSNNHFVPETAEDWDTVDIDISNFAGEDIMLKFTSINDNGSSIYVDNVSVTGSGMFAETTDDKDVFSLYPNPARHEVKMVFENTRSNQGRISLYNMQGKIMKHLSLPAGKNSYKLQLSGIPSGIYVLRFTGKNQTSVRRLVVE